jgi:arylsulfatase A-like enzyme
MKRASLPIPENARKVAVFNRNGWQLCSGTSGNFQPEWVALLLRNMHVFDEYGPVRMIRNERWKYVHRYPYGPHELYDIREDPQERQNLYADKAYGKRAAELKGELDSWFHRYVDPAVDGCREGVTGKGQLGLVGPVGRGNKVWADDWHYLSRPIKHSPDRP